MKKYFYLFLLAVLPMCFIACSSDDDDEPTGVAGIETLYGSWQQTHGVAFEDGGFHHDNDVSADEAEYLRFFENGKCYVAYGHRGIFSGDKISTFTFDADSKKLIIGTTPLEVDVLSGGTLKLKYYTSSNEYILATYKKVSDSVWDNL